MIDLKGFRKANGLTQDELGQYLGMKKSFVSKVENGREKLPKDKFQKLLTNDKGWDVTMLSSENESCKEDSIRNNQGRDIITDADKIAVLRKENEMLRAQVGELKAQNERYWNMIEKLTEK